MSVEWDGEIFYTKEFNQNIDKIKKKVKLLDDLRSDFNFRMGFLLFVSIVLVFAHPFIFIVCGSALFFYTRYLYKESLSIVNADIKLLLDKKISLLDNKKLWYNRRFNKDDKVKSYREAINLEKNHLFKYDEMLISYLEKERL